MSGKATVIAGYFMVILSKMGRVMGVWGNIQPTRFAR